MAQKTLSIVIDTKLTGEASYDKLKTALNGTDVSIKSFNSTLITSGENIGQWVNKVQLASDSLAKLRHNSTTLGSTLGVKFNVSPISNIQSDPFKDEKKSLEELLFTYRQNSAKLLSEMNNRLTLMKSIRQNGANDIRTLEIRAAQEEELIRQNASNRLLAIEQSLRDGVITSVRDAERQRAAIIRQSLNDINNVRKAFEREENKIEVKSAKIAAYRNETEQLITELNRRVALERAIHQHGADSTIVNELKVANEQIAIRQRLSQRLQEIENAKTNNVRLRGDTGFISYDTARTKAIIQAENELIATHNKLASALDSATQAQKNLFVHVAEIIGIYRVLNFVINATLNSLKAIPNIGIQLEATQAVLATTAGSLGAAQAVLGALTREAERTGIAVSSLRESFRNFSASTKIAGESMETTWKIFQNMNTVITALHLSGDQATHVFNALAQIFNKSKVQSEELVKQLGNLIPGAFASFAKAIGLLPSELSAQMKKGLVFAHENILKFSDQLAKDFAASFALAQGGLNASIGRMKTSFTLLGEAIYTSTSGPLHFFTESMTGLANYTRESINEVTALTVAFKGITYAAAISGLVALSNAIITFNREVGIATALSTKWQAALAWLRTPTGFIAGIAAITLGIHEMVRGSTSAIDKMDELLKLAEKAREDAEKSKTKQGFAAVAIENDVGLQELRRQYAEVAKEKQALDKSLGVDALFNITPTTIAAGLKKLDGSYGAILAKQKKFAEEIKTRENQIRLSAESDFESSNNTGEILSKQEELRIAALQAQGKVAEAAQAQFEKTYEDSKKQAETIIDGYIENEIRITKALENIKKQLELPGNAENANLLGSQLAAQSELDQLNTRYDQALEVRKNYIIGLQGAIDNSLNKSTSSINKNLEASERKLTSFLKLIDAELKEKLNSINLIAETAKNKIELNIAQNKPGNDTKLIDIQFTKELDLINAQIEAEKRKQNTIKETSRLQEQSVAQQTVATDKLKLNLDRVFSAIKQFESTNGKNIISPTGALGIGQVQPSTFKGLGYNVPQNILDIEKSAKQKYFAGLDTTLTPGERAELLKFAIAHQKELEEAARKYFEEMVTRYKGDVVKAVAAYNAGPGNVDKATRLAQATAANDTFFDFLPRKQETTPYVKNVINAASDGKFSEIALRNTEKLSDVNAKLNELYDKRNLLNQQYVIDLTKAEETSKALITELQAQVLESQGQETQAQQLRLSVEYRTQYNELVAKGANAEVVLLDQLFNRKNVEIQLNEYLRKANLEKTKFGLTEQKVQAEIIAGALTQREGIKQITDAKIAYISKLNEALVKQQEALDKDKDNLKILEQILAIKGEINNLRQPSGVGRQLQNDALDNTFPGLGETINTYDERKGRLESDIALETQRLITDNHLSELDARKQAESKYAADIFQVNASLYGGIASVGANTFLGLTKNLQKMYGEQSKQARLAFAAYKALAITQTIIETAKSAQASFTAGASWGPAGVFLGPAAAAAAIAFGAIQIASIVSQPMPAAHGGLDNVPKEQTYLLDKGERVLSPNQNRDLTRFLKEPNVGASNQQSQQPQNIRIINTLDSSSMDNYLGSDSAERIIRNYIRQEVA